MSTILITPSVGSCIRTATLPMRSGPIAITKPVGQGPLARNIPSDVKTIQEALNQVTVKGLAGSPVPLLVIDGIKCRRRRLQ